MTDVISIIYANVNNNLAWMLASHPDPQIRNGKEAVDLAERACRLTNNEMPIYLGTLAAAYAEAGRFSDAVATAEKARDLARKAGLGTVAQRNEQLLELYRAGRPYHEPADAN
jgi:tetratricopeptide (TPR) repeat protein